MNNNKTKQNPSRAFQKPEHPLDACEIHPRKLFHLHFEKCVASKQATDCYHFWNFRTDDLRHATMLEF